MPTYDIRALAVPQDFVAVLSLAEGRYAVQNVDRTASCWLRESVDAPASGELGIRLAPGDSWVAVVASEPMWLWSFDEAGCSVVVNGGG